MSAARTRWRLQLVGHNPPPWDKFRSERATYDHVAQLRQDRAVGTLTFDHATVWTSDDGGEHWQLYERLNLTEVAPDSDTATEAGQ